MATIAIVAVMIAAALPFVANYITWGQNTVDRHNYTILNDALTRYKCEGGNVTGLTSGMNIDNLLTQMQTGVTYVNINHQLLPLTCRFRQAAKSGTEVALVH